MTALSILAPDDRQPVHETTVGEALRAAAAATPQFTALVDGSTRTPARRWTYVQLLAASEGAARDLLRRLDAGDRVAIWAPTSPEWLIFWYGAALAGITLVTVNPAYRADELAYVLEQSDVRGIAVLDEPFAYPSRALLDEVRDGVPGLREVFDLTATIETATARSPDAGRAALPTVAPDGVAQIQYTSGTTGFPKGAMLHHRGITNDARFYAQRLGMGEHEVYLSPMPMFHVGGSVLSPLAVLATRSTLVTMTRFDATAMLELIEEERATVTIGVPTMFIDVLDHPQFEPARVATMRHIMCGGAHTPADLVHRLSDGFGATIHNSFGQTEGGPVITMTAANDDPDDVARTVGFPLPQVEIKIIDVATGDVVPRGAAGELCARGYQVMKGYFRMDAITATTIDAEGWLHTGDICAMDERGYLTVEGRLKEMIIRGGENVFPTEIEEVIFRLPGVADVAVVGVPDGRLGEAVAAFIRAEDGAVLRADELAAQVRNRLAREKVPAHWRFVDGFPLTPNGKIMKHVLRDQFGAPDESTVVQSPPGYRGTSGGAHEGER